MVSQRKRHLFLGLGLTVALVLAVSSATASAASTLTGESLTGASASGNTFACLTPTYSVSGTATGPYPGTFTETGTWSLSTVVFSATFTTSSGTTTINGSKTGKLGLGSGLFGGISCNQPLGEAHADLTGVPYTATIHTANGNFHDEGTSTVVVNILGSTAELSETFASSLTQPVRLAPTNKDQCKNGGWQGFFKNQGECVSSVQSQRPS